MQRFLLLYLITLISSNSLLNAQQYYPLDSGNKWFYSFWEEPNISDTVSCRIVSDSVLPNGRHYFALDREDITGGTYLRYDSNSVYYYVEWDSSDAKMLRFDANVNDSWDITFFPYFNVTLSSVDSLVVFGTPTRVLSFRLEGLMTTTIRVSDRFGPLTQWFYGDPPPPLPIRTMDLIGSIIADTAYGYVLSIGDDRLSSHDFNLYQNYPNPFNPDTRITYYLPTSTRVDLTIFNILGQEVHQLVDGNRREGFHTLLWNGTDRHGNHVSSGIYIYMLRAGNAVFSKRMLYLK